MISILVAMVLHSNVFAESAVRKAGTSWRDYAHREKALPESAMSAAKPYTGDNYEGVQSWSSGELKERFKMIRDTRHLKWTRDAEFPRRISWLYPADGCYSRAALGNGLLEKEGIALPHKIFAFGDLRVETPYDSDGSVTWWYHVAQVVDVGGTRYVIDPSIDSKGAMTVDEWLKAMGTPEEIEVAVCKPGTYVPRSNCNIDEPGSQSRSPIQSLLNREWNGVKNLDLDPTQVLGDAPPWAE